MAAPFQLVGQLLGHYRVSEQIGAGGMGVVYRAHDEQLDRDVAIKVLLPGTLADDASRKRFRKEALSLAKLNHPNIATVHEFGSQGGTDFLVTEYIGGTTLDGKLSAGALPPQQVIELGVQIAQGLSAAHEHGIIHRDLKPANLRFTSDERLKILDFGLAQLVPYGNKTDSATTVTRPQEISGTLPYMSPEQLRGGMVDARTDIWAAGAVLYEMLTAHRAFEEKVPTALIGDILHKAPLLPHKLRSGLSPKLERVILKCLQKEPSKRYQSARELQSDLERLRTGATPGVMALYWLRPVVAGAIALSLGATASWYLVTHRNRPAPSPFNARRSVAVLGFKNVSRKPDASWISTALSEMLTAELAAGERLRTIPGENVARTKLDLSLPDTDSYSRDTLARIHKNLNADYVVLGSYFDAGKEAGGQVRLDLWLQDARAGETIAAVSETGTEAQLLDLVTRTGSVLRSKLGAGEVTPADAGMVRASVPSDPQTARLYAEGLKKLRAFDALGARQSLERALTSEPGFPLAHSALAEVWSRLGYDVKAKEEARRAFDLSANLLWEDRLSVEARYRESNKERDKAIELYRKLFSAFPDNIDFGLRLAAAQRRSGKGKDALVTVSALRQMSPPAREDPRIDLAEANVTESIGEFKRAQAAVDEARKKAGALGAPLLLAAAQLELCSILRNRGQYQEAREACDNARDTYARSGDRVQTAIALLGVGGISYEQGDLAEAQKAEEEALTVFRHVGHESGIASTLSELANVLSARGDHLGAESRYEQALATYRKLEDKANIGAMLHNIAGQLNVEGNLDEANTRFRQALAVNRELGQEDVEAMDLANYGSTLFLQGDLAASARALDQSLEICHRIDFKQACGVALSSQGDLLSWGGRLDQALGKYKEAWAVRKDMGAAIEAAETQVSIAELSIEAGQSVDAETSVRDAREVFRKQKLLEDEIWASAVLCRALVAQGKSADAGKELDAAMRLGAKIQNEEVRLKLALAMATVRAATGRPADQVEVSKSLTGMLAEAKQHGFFGYQLEARLALGELEMKSAQTAAGRAHLTALEKEARSKGFLLLARKAAVLLRSADSARKTPIARLAIRVQAIARVLPRTRFNSRSCGSDRSEGLFLVYVLSRDPGSRQTRLPR